MEDFWWRLFLIKMNLGINTDNHFGVYCHGATDADVPDALEEFADAIVGWRKDKISSAISGESYFEKADGSVRPFISMGRSTC